MKIKFNDSNLALYIDLINIIKIKADGELSFKINRDGSYQVPNSFLNSFKVLEMMNNDVLITGYSVWLEIQNVDFTNNITESVSFATYFDDQEPPIQQHRTWNDLSVFRTGTNSKIVYWQSGTSEISKDDLQLFTDDPKCVVYGIKELQMRMSYKDYFVSSDEVPTYVPYSFVTYEQFDTYWQQYFKNWNDAQTYIAGMWDELGGERFYALKWQIEEPLNDAESAIAYAYYPGFPEIKI
jgi:hypothetical protein